VFRLTKWSSAVSLRLEAVCEEWEKEEVME
jgi:hypothetical protein